MKRDDILKLLMGGQSGVREFNALREQFPRIKSLTGTDFSKRDLCKVNFNDVNLSECNFRDCKLNGARFRDADLYRVGFEGCELIGADFTSAVMSCADMEDADVSHALFRGTDLSWANLAFNSAIDADFSEALFDQTKISRNWRNATGLESAIHEGPSQISVHTILDLGQDLPKSFLIGCGLQDEEIEHFLARIGSPIRHYSGFISYSHANMTFANRLHDQLQGRGIRCYRDKTHLRLGDRLRPRINEAIRIWDKTLLCCSKESLSSEWVDEEIESAFDKEHQLRVQHGEEVLALIPLDLDGFLFSPECSNPNGPKLRARLAGKFKGWESDNAIFEREFEKVVAAMRSDERAREKPPAPQIWTPKGPGNRAT